MAKKPTKVVRVKAHSREVQVDRPPPRQTRIGDEVRYTGPEGRNLPMRITHMIDGLAAGVVSGPDAEFNVSGVPKDGERRWDPADG